ncbi:hypothetical protein EAO70_04905 [Streptomyces sp. adm13(2018)]|uniref:hypothetical protein n=1 Tax=Streptomyces sp. adm13(2018) TaxID=2479007 RepID=UPI0011CECE02|nr:hypothetical protein [Streptomyces sp. adm13(2018)]TXS23112.1 hypothetical protein EAO70_04905 [Streptomyces sp. adm13(2018)]
MTAPLVTFEPLPERTSSNGRRNTGKHAAIADLLRKRPNEWARVLTPPKASSARTMAYSIRTGGMPCYGPAGSFEAKSRTVNGKTSVYARYVGGDR